MGESKDRLFDESFSGMDDRDNSLTFDDKVVRKITGFAVNEVRGIIPVGGSFITGILRNSEDLTKGITIDVIDSNVTVDLKVVCEYGQNIPKIFRDLANKLARVLREMTGLSVVRVNMHVFDVLTRDEFERQSRKRSEERVETKEAISEEREHLRDYIDRDSLRDSAEPHRDIKPGVKLEAELFITEPEDEEKDFEESGLVFSDEDFDDEGFEDMSFEDEDFKEDELGEDLEDDLSEDLEEDLEDDLGEDLEDYLGDDLEEVLEDDLEEVLDDDLEEDLDDDLEEDLDDDLDEDFMGDDFCNDEVAEEGLIDVLEESDSETNYEKTSDVDENNAVEHLPGDFNRDIADDNYNEDIVSIDISN